ncbi:MAG: type II toxin-antitoxin system Phd/YefM family antitoxin [Oscillospiraceae bacterium]|nr:type II toxin-antitoxin system Phd/YefM family antitoxin [Oscillospiraceae bacterium]
MIITATEFKTNFGKYLEMIALSQEDIFITKNGKTVAKVSNPQISAVDKISGILSGLVPSELDTKKIREERLSEYENND